MADHKEKSFGDELREEAAQYSNKIQQRWIMANNKKLEEENARLRSLIEELIPMAEQYKKGIVGLSDRAAYRTGEVISRARSLLTAGDKATDPDHNKPDL
jgi:hypothetical protein